MEKIKAFCVRYVLPILGAIAAIFSYTYYKKRQEAEERAKASNVKHDEQLKEVKGKVDEVVEAKEQVNKAIEKVNAIQPKPVRPTDTLQESIDDANKY